MEPELVCIDGSGKSSGFGVLRGGFMIQTSTSLARKYVTICTFLSEQFYVSVDEDCFIFKKFLCLVCAL